MARPSFKDAWAASMRIYDPTNPSAKVAKVIGGRVAYNINQPYPYGWTNTCAVRISYILNQSGMHIPSLRGETVKGDNNDNYFFRIYNVIVFLTERWGKPDMVAPYPPSRGGSLIGKKGLIMFEITLVQISS